MNLFHFGPSHRPLLGVHHPRSARAADRGAVVLCYPWGPEYMRAHRAFRQLANMVAREGHDVLRFDFSGTGDSMGEPHDVSPETWRQDVGRAIDEIRELTGASAVRVAGLRLGGTLALEACLSRDDVERLVLWDPVILGDRYLDEMGRLFGVPELSRRTVEVEGAVGVGLGGFLMTPEVQGWVRGLEGDVAVEGAPAQATSRGPQALDVVLSNADLVSDDEVQRLGVNPARVRRIVTPGDGSWAEGDMFGSMLLPGDILRSVAECLTQPAAPPMSEVATDSRSRSDVLSGSDPRGRST